LFSILLSAFLLSVIFWLTVGGDRKVYDRYLVYFQESVAGLSPKATVRYRGVQIGRVESIRIDPNNPGQVEVVLGIERGTPIRRDTIATLSTQGLTGVASVELSGGGQSPTLDMTQDIPVIKAGPSLVARLDDAFNNILTNLNNLYSKLENLLSDGNQEAISKILQNMSIVTGEIANRSKGIGQIVANTASFSASLEKRSEQLGKVLERLSASLEEAGSLSCQLRATVKNFISASNSVRKTADTFNQTGRDLSRLANTGQSELRRLGQISEAELSMLLLQAGDLVATLQKLASMIEKDPRVLLIGAPIGKPGPGEE
jgi:phospholipid/cholesterol/gamma-HCH transport system substrate-binding protein